MPRASSFSNKVKQDSILFLPFGVFQSRCSHSVWASSVRLSFGNRSTVSCTCASCLRVNRRPLNVVPSKLSTDFIGVYLAKNESKGQAKNKKILHTPER